SIRASRAMNRAAFQRDPDTSIGGAATRFPSTRPSLVGAGRPATLRKDALDAFAIAYWKPVYTHIRWKWRASNEDAKDFTQAFFGLIVSEPILARFDPERASFRTYLRLCVDRFVANRRAGDRRLKRGGGASALTVDDAEVQELLPPDPALSV